MLEQRWILIQEAFTQPIQSSLDLEKAILTYNSRYNGIWEFKGLHAFVTEVKTKKNLVIKFVSLKCIKISFQN